MDIYHLTINPIDYERRINNQAESSKNAGYGVTILALGKPGERSTFEKNGIIVRRIKTPFYKGGPLKFIHFNAKVFFSLIFKRLYIIHCHDLWTLPAVYLLRILKKFSFVYDAHEYFEGLEIFNRNKIRKRLWMLAEKIAIRRIDVLITVSEPIAGLYRKKFPDLKDVEVIRNVPKQEVLFDSQTHNIFPETHKKIILYQGHFKPGRGLLPLIEAMTFIDEAHLVLIGGGELEDELLESIKMHDVQHKISLLGYIPTDRLITVASTTDLGIVLFEPTSLNYKYALPNKLFEYIMAGLPVLASNIETFRFYIDKYKLGLTVDPQNAQKIAQQIRLILSDEQKLEEWRKNAKHASTILNWENESKILEKVYEQIQ